MSVSRETNTDELQRLLDVAAKIVSAYVEFNRSSFEEVPKMLRTIYDTAHDLLNGASQGPGDLPHDPAVPVKKSVTDDFIICLEDGKKLRTLKRYLKTQYNLTPDEYRTRWKLPRDYPMVAPSYTRLRSAFAKKIGLGHTQPAPTKRKK